VSRPSSRRAGPVAVVAIAALVVAACSGPILAVPPIERPGPPAPSAQPARQPDPIPITLPADDGPHERLTEWWYYTGHLADASGGRYGFEYVVFRAERGAFPVSWASHLAVTDESGGRFLYAQRSQVGPGVDVSSADAASSSDFAFSLAGDQPKGLAPDHPTWEMTRADGIDRLAATLSEAEALTAGSTGSMALDLRVETDRPPVLHDRDGWIDFGGAGGSYYYSRTRMAAAGTLTLDGKPREVDGTAWFDHQWGDFIAVGGGGWDWYAVGLEDGTDLTISQVRDATGEYPLVYGTIVDPNGSINHLPAESLIVTVTDRWTSPRTGAEYPAGWTIAVPNRDLVVRLRPTVADQELDTRLTTGVVYWEGSQHVRATRAGRSIGGEAYVELTGYANGR